MFASISFSVNAYKLVDIETLPVPLLWLLSSFVKLSALGFFILLLVLSVTGTRD
jgi:hypothetical protein